jgi:hypothetical protein
MEWVHGLGLVNACDKTLSSTLTSCDMRCCLEHDGLGVLCVERVNTIPHVRSLQKFYLDRYNINLAESLGVEKSWILPWAHMLAASAQICIAGNERKIGMVYPFWLKDACQQIVQRYGGVVSLEVLDICRKREWMVDRMLLSGNPRHEDADDKFRDKRDLAVLFVLQCVNEECRKNRGRKELSLYFAPKIMEQISKSLAIALTAHLAHFNVHVSLVSSKKHKGASKNADLDIATAADFNHVLDPPKANAFSANDSLNLDQGGLW